MDKHSLDSDGTAAQFATSVALSGIITTLRLCVSASNIHFKYWALRGSWRRLVPNKHHGVCFRRMDNEGFNFDI